ncbi:MAG: BadF/BadG/BcrA/BcrD ATPase family protein [Nitriliruptoraceae bacterium]
MSVAGRTSLLVDAGRTGVRIARWDGARAVPLAEGPGLPMLAEAGGPEAAARAIAALVPEHADVEVVAGGLTGLMELPGRTQEIAQALLRSLGASGVVLTSDVVTSHLGALAGQSGVVAAVGTGTVVLGLSPSGDAAKVDGWGYLLGDAGSGFDVGRQGLSAAMAAHDGRQRTLLAAAAQARFGPLSELPGRVYAEPEPVHLVASFAPDVAAAARRGDAVALGIWDAAAAAVARAIGAALEHARLDDQHRRVSLAGSLGRLDLLHERVRVLLERDAAPVKLVPPQAGALGGAGLLLDAQVREWLGSLAHVFHADGPPTGPP